MTALTFQDLSALQAWIQETPRLQKLYKHVISQSDGDAAHDSAHLLRVAFWTVKIAGEAAEECVAAALLHDLVNIPKNHPDRARASDLSAQAATPLLREAQFSDAAIARITGAIRDHSFSRGAIPSSSLGKALQDADRLEALGAIGIMRVFSTGARMGTRYFDPQDPWARARKLDDTAFSVDHFFTKLLRLPETFQTEAGKREGNKRATVLKEFLSRLGEEIGEPLP
jgi:uncharacterized protein